MPSTNDETGTRQRVERLLARKTGATVEEMAEATEAAPRTIRNLITVLRREGVKVVNVERGSGRFQMQAKKTRKRASRRQRPATAH